MSEVSDNHSDRKPVPSAAVPLLVYFDHDESETYIDCPIYFPDGLKDGDWILVKAIESCKAGRVFIDFGEYQFPLRNHNGSFQFDDNEIKLRACLKITFDQAGQCFYFDSKDALLFNDY